MYDSDVAKYNDVFNFHTYDPPAGYSAQMAALRGFLRRYGVSDMPIWLTECGTNLEGHSGEDGVRKGLKAHSPD